MHVCVYLPLQNSFPKGSGPYDAAFGEFPWQAMILKESTKSLLCGGAIIQADTVLTAANCVQGYVWPRPHQMRSLHVINIITPPGRTDKSPSTY